MVLSAAAGAAALVALADERISRRRYMLGDAIVGRASRGADAARGLAGCSLPVPAQRRKAFVSRTTSIRPTALPSTVRRGAKASVYELEQISAIMPTCGSVLALLGYLMPEMRHDVGCMPGGIGAAGMVTTIDALPGLPISTTLTGGSTCLYAAFGTQADSQNALVHAAIDSDVLVAALLLQDPRPGLRANPANNYVWSFLTHESPIEFVDGGVEQAKRAMIACMLIRSSHEDFRRPPMMAVDPASLLNLATSGFATAIMQLDLARNLRLNEISEALQAAAQHGHADAASALVDVAAPHVADNVDAWCGAVYAAWKAFEDYLPHPDATRARTALGNEFHLRHCLPGS